MATRDQWILVAPSHHVAPAGASIEGPLLPTEETLIELDLLNVTLAVDSAVSACAATGGEHE